MQDLMEITHASPVWREKSNFIIAAAIEDENKYEQLWVRKVDDFQFELCCIPFFVYGANLGDIVETDEDYVVTRVIKASNRKTFRVWLGDSRLDRDWLVTRIQDSGGLLEWSSSNLVAIDTSDKIASEAVQDFLQDCEREGLLSYETGD